MAEARPRGGGGRNSRAQPRHRRPGGARASSGTGDGGAARSGPGRQQARGAPPCPATAAAVGPPPGNGHPTPHRRRRRHVLAPLPRATSRPPLTSPPRGPLTILLPAPEETAPCEAGRGGGGFRRYGNERAREAARAGADVTPQREAAPASGAVRPEAPQSVEQLVPLLPPHPFLDSPLPRRRRPETRGRSVLGRRAAGWRRRPCPPRAHSLPVRRRHSLWNPRRVLSAR